MIVFFLRGYIQHAPHKDIVLSLLGEYNMVSLVVHTIQTCSLSSREEQVHLASLLDLLQSYVQLDLKNLS